MGCTSSSSASNVIESKSKTTKDSHLEPINIHFYHHKDQFGHEVDDLTGARIFSDDYYKYRTQAEEHAKLRGSYFEKSKQSFQKNKKAEAKELSNQGKHQTELMDKANEQAVNEILEPQKLFNSDQIDLHGLHVAEAVDATKIWALVQFNKHHKYTIQIITGAGNHSDPKKGAVIKPAIIKLCKDEKWRFEADNHNHGVLIVYFDKNKPKDSQ